MKKILSVAAAVSFSMLAGCGGGGGGDSSSTSGDGGSTNPAETRSLIASFSNSKKLNYPYDFINGIALFDVNGIHTASFTFNVNVYDDGSVETLNTRYNIYDKGVLNRLFVVQNASNSTIDASCINNYTCYDKTSKKYYDLDFVSDYERSKLIAVTNDGLTAVMQNSDNTTQNIPIVRSYSEVEMSSVGINIKPVPILYQGVASDLVESGFADSETGKPYTFEGIHYLYTIQGASVSGAQYAIYNNGNATILNSNSSTPLNGYVSTHYKRVKPVDKINTSYEYVSSYTYYDNAGKIFYETTNPYGQDTIIEITNDGNTAVFSSGRKFQITKAYQKVE